MRVTWLPDVVSRPRHVAVGEFDCVHRGHREVIRGADTVLTFEPHPRAVVGGAGAPPLLTPLEVKADRVAELGVAELVVVPFDAAFARISAADFVSEILVERVGATRVSVGENFRFGHRASGDVALLRADRRFTTRVAGLVRDGNELISSSRIRARMANGEVERANQLLGASFELRGTVVRGDQRGRTLGFPTANLMPSEKLALPGQGIYACRAAVRRGESWEWHAAATSIGVRPTFDTVRDVLVEVHMLDFAGNLYGERLRVTFEGRLRGEQRFDSAEELIEQMQRDVEHSRKILAESGAMPSSRVVVEM